MKKIYVYMQMLVVAMMAMTVFTSCEEDDQYLASTLRNRDWQGYIGAYYQDRWGISGSEYATVMRFSSKDEWYTSGRGVELDYNTRSPHSDYAYCTDFRNCHWQYRAYSYYRGLHKSLHRARFAVLT